jgi:hypothetical protein
MHKQTWHGLHAGRSRSAVPVCVLLTFFTFAPVGCPAKNDSSDAAAPPNLSPTKVESARTKEELWRRAADGDPADLARLADREGAMGLLDGLEEGGDAAAVALQAIPWAEDAEVTYQRLGEIIRQIDPGETEPVLAAIAGIARRPRPQSEPVDPWGLRSCGAALLYLTQQKDLPKQVRVAAIGTLRLMADRNGVDPAAIPTDLDAR